MKLAVVLTLLLVAVAYGTLQPNSVCVSHVDCIPTQLCLAHPSYPDIGLAKYCQCLPGYVWRADLETCVASSLIASSPSTGPTPSTTAIAIESGATKTFAELVVIPIFMSLSLFI